MSDVKTIRLFGVAADSVVDGMGFRTAIFTQGCRHACPGCHNPESHDPAGGKEWTLDDIEKMFTGNPLLDGITLSGGEPFLQAEACAELARRAHARGLSVWVYSGFTYEELLRMAERDAVAKALLEECDVLVDGRYLQEQRSLELSYCGSRNQRVIDMAKTRRDKVVVLFAPPQW